MVFCLMVFICLTATFRGIRGDNDTEELGKAIYLRKVNLLDDFQEKEASVFESLPTTCFIKKDLHSTGSFFDYYASTKAFYFELATGAGLDASLQSSYSLGATLSSVAPKAESEESKVSGISLNVRALTKKILVKKDCLDATAKLSNDFIKLLEHLPKEIKKPWMKSSWNSYETLLKRYGSHVVTSVNLGVSIRQTAFAESSKSYSQRDFQVRTCLSFAGPTSAGKVGVKACANISKEERSTAKNMSARDKIIIRGGKMETRSALSTKRTEELIEKFLREAKESETGVEYTFRSIWNILQSRYEPGTDNYIKAVNLQYYYLGFLNYNCRFRQGRGIQIQKFDYTDGPTDESPEFECSLAAEGCHTNDDCHYKPIWCSCYGKSCVRYKTETQGDTGDSRTTAEANWDNDWGWHGCDWKLAGSRCRCYNDRRGSRRVVWSLPNRDIELKSSGHGVQDNFRNLDQGAKDVDHNEESTVGLIKEGVDRSREAAEPVKSDTDQIRGDDDASEKGADEIREVDGPRAVVAYEGREADDSSGESTRQSNDVNSPRARGTDQSREAVDPISGGTDQSKEADGSVMEGTERSRDGVSPGAKRANQNREADASRAKGSGQSREAGGPSKGSTAAGPFRGGANQVGKADGPSQARKVHIKAEKLKREYHRDDLM